jgi:hypothetical protein
MHCVDWFGDVAGDAARTITLARGQRLPCAGIVSRPSRGAARGQGLTWQPPGASGQDADPSSQLYLLAPGGRQRPDRDLLHGRKLRRSALTRRCVLVKSNGRTSNAVAVEDGSGRPRRADLLRDLVRCVIIPSVHGVYNLPRRRLGLGDVVVDGTAVPYATPSPASGPGRLCARLMHDRDKLDASCISLREGHLAEGPYCWRRRLPLVLLVLPVWTSAASPRSKPTRAAVEVVPAPGSGRSTEDGSGRARRRGHPHDSPRIQQPPATKEPSACCGPASIRSSR